MSSAEGSWKITIKTPMGPQVGTLELTAVTADSLSGTMTSRGETMAIMEGAVNGQDLSWIIRRKKPLPMTAKFAATIDGDRIAGKAKMGPMGEASFEGTRIKSDADAS